MTCIHAKPRTAYAGGLEKFWTKHDREDFYNPYFQGLGDQEILKQEVAYDGNTAVNEEVLAYQTRFAEYKYKYNTVHAEMRSTLKSWKYFLIS